MTDIINQNGDPILRKLCEAYLALLSLPYASPRRDRAQSLMATIRDAIAEESGYESEVVQEAFEALARGAHFGVEDEQLN